MLPTMENTETKGCAQCGEVKALDGGFYRSKRATDGRDSYCKECRDGRSAAIRGPRGPVGRPPNPVTPEKACTKCGVVKPLADFYSSSKGEGKRTSACKVCRDAYHATYVAREGVAERLREQDQERRTDSLTRPRRRQPVGPGFEVCTACNEDKPFAEFHNHKLGRNGKDSMCKDCKLAVARERNKDPETNERDHRKNKERLFGMYPGQYDEMLAAQGGVCALCGGVNGKRRLHVDHCHDTGKVRALLCNNCNMGLGSFKDDPVLMRSAADYVEAHKPQ